MLPLSYRITLAVGIGLFALCLYVGRDRMLRGSNDFTQLYAGASSVGSAQLYAPETSWRLQRSLFGATLAGVYYSRPPFYALLLAPLAYLPYLWAYGVFQTLSLAATAVFLWLYRDSELLLAAAFSFPLFTAFRNGQDTTFALCLAGVSLLVARTGRHFAAGMVLSLCAIKFHLFLLAPLAILLYRRWAMLRGMLVGGAALTVLSCLAGGWRWPEAYWHVLQTPGIQPPLDVRPTLSGLLAAFGAAQPVWIAVASLLVVGAFIYAAVRAADFEIAFALSTAAGLLVSYQSYVHDCVLLLLAFALLRRGRVSKRLRGALFLALLPPVYLLLLSGAPWNAAAPLALLLVLAIAVWEARYSSLNLAPEAAGEVLARPSGS